MGLSTAALSELGLIERKHDIGNMLSLLSNQKRSLTNDMQKVSQDYQAALRSRVLTWSNNGGASYIDLSYANLMRPSLMNQNTPYLLTDANGRIVIGKNYQKYAEMLSPNGEGGADWEAKRGEILSGLTGIPIETINGTANNQERLWELERELAELEASKVDEPTKSGGARSFIALAGNSTGVSGKTFSNADSWEKAYAYGSTIELGSVDQVESVLGGILEHLNKQISPYLSEKDAEAFTTACQDTLSEMTLTAESAKTDKGATVLENEDCPLSKNGSTYSVNVTKLVDWLISSYASNGGNVDNDVSNGSPILEWRDLGSAKHDKWIQENATWQALYDAKTSEYETLRNTNNGILTADQESSIEFYDTLFSAIAEKGWVLNESVDDEDYLNQMLQNNIYTLTTVERTASFDTKEGDFDWLNDYDTNIASNFTNIFAVSDDDAREEALVKYEYEKSIIKQKEVRIDTRMKDLETELSAINTMLQSKEQEKKDNIDRTFSAMG